MVLHAEIILFQLGVNFSINTLSILHTRDAKFDENRAHAQIDKSPEHKEEHKIIICTIEDVPENN